MTRIIEKIYSSDPYAGFPKDEYEVDCQGWGSQDPIFEEVIQETSANIIVEVGTWKGASAIHMGGICRSLSLATEIICVDTWLGSSELITEKAHPRWRDSLRYKFGYPQLFYTFMRNVLEADLSEVITPLPASSDVAYFALRRLGVRAGLIYIDGSHEYEAVARDLELYVGLLASDGVIVGDDFKSAGVQRAAEEFAAKQGFAIEDRGNKYVLRRRKLESNKESPGKRAKKKSKKENLQLEVLNITFDHLVQRIESKEPFTISRWGDCEWHIVFGRTEGQNLDRHRYMPGLVRDLNDILRSRPRYMLGLQPLARRFFEGRIESWLFEEQLDDLSWIESDVLHLASIHGRLDELLVALSGVPEFVVVGPPHLADTRGILGFTRHIEIPRENCYLEKDRILKEVIEAAQGLPYGSVITFSATATANILVHELYEKFGKTLSLIDVGSLWDPYAGVKSRKYMQSEKFRVAIPAEQATQV